MLEVFTIIAGGVAATCAFSMAVYFSRTKAGIGKAVAFDKAAEGVSMLVILVFSLTYYFGIFTRMPIELAAALRMSAIVATISSSIHLAYQTKQIIAPAEE